MTARASSVAASSRMGAPLVGFHSSTLPPPVATNFPSGLYATLPEPPANVRILVPAAASHTTTPWLRYPVAAASCLPSGLNASAFA